MCLLLKTLHYKEYFDDYAQSKGKGTNNNTIPVLFTYRTFQMKMRPTRGVSAVRDKYMDASIAKIDLLHFGKSINILLTLYRKIFKQIFPLTLSIYNLIGIEEKQCVLFYLNILNCGVH